MIAVDGIVKIHLFLGQIGNVIYICQRNCRLVGESLQGEHLHLQIVARTVQADLIACVFIISSALLGQLVFLPP